MIKKNHKTKLTHNIHNQRCVDYVISAYSPRYIY